MLEYYLPLSQGNDPTIYLVSNNTTLSFADTKISDSLEAFSKCTYTPIQLATYFGNINCIKVIMNFFGNSIIPWWLNVNHHDITTGENCAMLACKTGSFPMIKFLYTSCGADFNTFNILKENTLQIFLCACKQNQTTETLKIIKYLIDVIKIDYIESIEETLLVCESQQAISYLEGKCREKGLDIKKSQLEIENKIKIKKITATEKSEKDESVTMSHPSSISSKNGSNLSNFASVVNQL